MDFGRPNAVISQKMANGQLLFLALILLVNACVFIVCLFSSVAISPQDWFPSFIILRISRASLSRFSFRKYQWQRNRPRSGYDRPRIQTLPVLLWQLILQMFLPIVRQHCFRRPCSVSCSSLLIL